MLRLSAQETGRLADATDLAVDDALFGEDGLPDADKVTVALDELLASKPHLAARRVSGDVGQR